MSDLVDILRENEEFFCWEGGKEKKKTNKKTKIKKTKAARFFSRLRDFFL